MPAIRRITKQITYAAIFFTILFLVLFLFVFPSLNFLQRFKPAPPPARADIVIESVNPIIHPGRIDIVAQIRNPNARAGVANYPISFVLQNEAGEELRRININTYLLPGALHYLTALDVPATSSLHRVNIETPDEISFTELPADVPAPSFNSFLQGRGIRQFGDQVIEEQKGIVTNTSSLGFRYVEVTGVAYSADNQVVGVSTTFIGELQVGEQREFTLQWPAPAVPTERVIVIPTTNIFAADNLLDLKGDPALLR